MELNNKQNELVNFLIDFCGEVTQNDEDRIYENFINNEVFTIEYYTVGFIKVEFYTIRYNGKFIFRTGKSNSFNMEIDCDYINEEKIDIYKQILENYSDKYKLFKELEKLETKTVKKKMKI